MKRGIITSLAMLALWGGVGQKFAAAQFGTLGQAPPRVRPTISPFINMGAGGASTYYGIVRPQMDANRSIAGLQQGLNLLNADGSLKGQISSQTGANSVSSLQTGHQVAFFNYSHYFPARPLGSNTIAGMGARLGGGLGGLNTGFAGGGLGFGGGLGGGGLGGGGLGGGTFFSNNLAQPLIR
jgi:hypothetical protein